MSLGWIGMCWHPLAKLRVERNFALANLSKGESILDKGSASVLVIALHLRESTQGHVFFHSWHLNTKLTDAEYGGITLIIPACNKFWNCSLCSKGNRVSV